MEDLRACGAVRLGRRRQRRRAARTDLDGRNAEAARLEDDADAAGRDALAEPTNHPAGDQDVLHLASTGNLGPDKSHAAAAPLLNPWSHGTVRGSARVRAGTQARRCRRERAALGAGEVLGGEGGEGNGGQWRQGGWG